MNDFDDGLSVPETCAELKKRLRRADAYFKASPPRLRDATPEERAIADAAFWASVEIVDKGRLA